MDRPWVPMPGVSWRVVVRVHPARVPDVVCVHALCPRLHCSTLIARPSRLSVISRASVDGLNVDQMSALQSRGAATLSAGSDYFRQCCINGRIRYDAVRASDAISRCYEVRNTNERCEDVPRLELSTQTCCASDLK